MKNRNNHFNNIGISSEADMPRIRHLMKIGLAAGILALIGNILLGYGAADTEVYGIPAAFARYMTVSDRRLFWSAILGMTGITLECLCYFSIYRLIASKSEKYAHTYRSGIFGCLVFGGCGIHVPCCASVYFMKKMVEYNPDSAFKLTMNFMVCFLVPAAVLFLIFFLILIVTQVRVFAKGLTPLPKWAWIFSVLFGLPVAAALKIPNLPLTNALATGWINIGNLWMFGGLLWLTRKAGGTDKGGMVQP